MMLLMCLEKTWRGSFIFRPLNDVQQGGVNRNLDVLIWYLEHYEANMSFKKVNSKD